MEPGEILSTAAQIAVALAGFAGVVVAFRRESVHEWPALDKYRLRLLLTNSVVPLVLCIIGLLLLGIKPAATVRPDALTARLRAVAVSHVPAELRSDFQRFYGAEHPADRLVFDVLEADDARSFGRQA